MLASKLRLEQIGSLISGKRVLMRVDFNVPIKGSRILDMTRITSTLESINFIRNSGARSLVLMSHLGRPDGNYDPKYSLKPILPELSKLLGTQVNMLDDCIGPEVERACKVPEPGSVILLENLRFHLPEEGSIKQPDGTKSKSSASEVANFRQSLSKLGDIYVNDAFGTAHRAHSSVVGVDLPIRAAGFLMSKELEYFSKAVENPKRPLVVILGGAKVKDKIPLITNLLKIADNIIIGGGMCFTFKKVIEHYNIGHSIFDQDSAEFIKRNISDRYSSNKNIILPTDFYCASSAEATTKPVLAVKEIPYGVMGLDIGPASAKAFSEIISKAATVIWNGPVGMFENPLFASGSDAIFNAILENKNCVSIVGGGDTASFIQSKGKLASHISHISTGGGASLELLEGKVLPGISALSDKSVLSS